MSPYRIYLLNIIYFYYILFYMYTSELICMKLMCVSVGGAADAVHSGDGGVGSAWGWQPTRCTPHGTTPSHFPVSPLF